MGKKDADLRKTEHQILKIMFHVCLRLLASAACTSFQLMIDQTSNTTGIENRKRRAK